MAKSMPDEFFYSPKLRNEHGRDLGLAAIFIVLPNFCCCCYDAVFAVAVLADLQSMSILGQSKHFALSEASIVNRIFGTKRKK